MGKKEQDYNRIYGDIPNNIKERFSVLIEKLNIRKKEYDVIVSRIKNVIYNTEWYHENFVFYIIPEGTPRPRVGKRGIFYVKGAASDRIFFKNYLEESNNEYDIITTPCVFDCRVYMPLPSTMNRIEKIMSELGVIRPISIPDWDNIGKKYCDMIQSSLLLNDSLVIDGRVRKYYSYKPRVEVRISYIEDYISSYNRSKVSKWKS